LESEVFAGKVDRSGHTGTKKERTTRVDVIDFSDRQDIDLKVDNGHSFIVFCSMNAAKGRIMADLGSHIKDPALRTEIGLPKDHKIVATIIIGYPGTIPSRPPRRTPRIFRIIE